MKSTFITTTLILLALSTSAIAEPSVTDTFNTRATKAQVEFKECFTGFDNGKAKQCEKACENSITTAYRYSLGKEYPKESTLKVFKTSVWALSIRYSPSNEMFQCRAYKS